MVDVVISFLTQNDESNCCVEFNLGLNGWVICKTAEYFLIVFRSGSKLDETCEAFATIISRLDLKSNLNLNN